MLPLMLSLATLVVAQPAKGDDPEPPKPGPISVRLVAKKAKYKLDLGGEKKADYIRLVKAGKVEPPKVELEVEFCNNTKETIRIRATGGRAKIGLTLQGTGAISGETRAKDGLPVSTFTPLRPGEKMTVPLDRLADLQSGFQASRGRKTHFWTEPGEYTLSASIYLAVRKSDGETKGEIDYQNLRTRPITVTVEK